jgi:hypothetical protein
MGGKHFLIRSKGHLGQDSDDSYSTQRLTVVRAVSFAVYVRWIEPMKITCFTCAIVLLTVTTVITGCRGRQHAIVLNDDDKDMVGSHEAGAETWKPLINESVAKLLGRACHDVNTVSYTTPSGTPVRKVCFVGVENRSSEPIGDFREQIYEHVDSLIGQSDQFRMISRRYVEAAMAECRCRPDLLVLPDKQRELQAALERTDNPFDYILFAQITSGTTQSNKDYQRNYLLTLELLDIHSGESLKESAELRKGYSKSKIGMFQQYGRRK